MSCPECMYITGHAETCTRGTSERVGDVESRLLLRIEELEERVRKLEEREGGAYRPFPERGGGF